MAYVSNDLNLVIENVGGKTPRIFTYKTADNLAAITGAGYFSDGSAKGLRVGDLIHTIAPTGAGYSMFKITAVNATTGAATASAATAIA